MAPTSQGKCWRLASTVALLCVWVTTAHAEGDEHAEAAHEEDHESSPQKVLFVLAVVALFLSLLEQWLEKLEHHMSRDGHDSLGAQVFNTCCQEATMVGMFSLICENFMGFLKTFHVEHDVHKSDLSLLKILGAFIASGMVSHVVLGRLAHRWDLATHMSASDICDTFDPEGNEHTKDFMNWAILKHRFELDHNVPKYFDFAFYLRQTMGAKITHGFEIKPTTWLILAAIWMLKAFGLWVVDANYPQPVHEHLPANMTAHQHTAVHDSDVGEARVAQLMWSCGFRLTYTLFGVGTMYYARSRCQQALEKLLKEGRDPRSSGADPYIKSNTSYPVILKNLAAGDMIMDDDRPDRETRHQHYERLFDTDGCQLTASIENLMVLVELSRVMNAGGYYFILSEINIGCGLGNGYDHVCAKAWLWAVVSLAPVLWQTLYLNPQVTWMSAVVKATVVPDDNAWQKTIKAHEDVVALAQKFKKSIWSMVQLKWSGHSTRVEQGSTGLRADIIEEYDPQSDLTEAQISTAFKILDADKSGDITPEELRCGLRHVDFYFNDVQWAQMKRVIDADDSGTISRDEFDALLRKCAHDHKVFATQRAGAQGQHTGEEGQGTHHDGSTPTENSALMDGSSPHAHDEDEAI